MHFDMFPLNFQISRLHCLLPWWEDATVDFMIKGGYNVIDQIKQVLFFKHPAYEFSLFKDVKVSNFCSSSAPLCALMIL